MGLDESPNEIQLSGPEAVIPGRFQGFQPEFTSPLLPFHMHVRWLIAVETREEEPIRPGDPADSWHSDVSPPVNRMQIIPHNEGQMSLRPILVRLPNDGIPSAAGRRGTRPCQTRDGPNRLVHAVVMPAGANCH